MAQETFTVASSGNYEDSLTGHRFQLMAGSVIPMELAVRFGLSGAAISSDSARTATADGTGTGLIADGTNFVTVTSDNANHIITLPTPSIGATLGLYVALVGYELAGPINGGDGTSSIPADTLTVCVSPDGTAWRCTDQAADGSVVTTEVAA